MSSSSYHLSKTVDSECPSAKCCVTDEPERSVPTWILGVVAFLACYMNLMALKH